MGRTSDARKGIAFPSDQGGAGRAHVEGEWLGRMFRAGRHAIYMPWSPEGRGPGSGAPHEAGSPVPAPSNSARISWFWKSRVESPGGALAAASTRMLADPRPPRGLMST
jgi:hypothetical protein